MEKNKTKSLDANGICEIIKTCGESNVKEFSYKGLAITFHNRSNSEFIGKNPIISDGNLPQDQTKHKTQTTEANMKYENEIKDGNWIKIYDNDGEIADAVRPDGAARNGWVLIESGQKVRDLKSKKILKGWRWEAENDVYYEDVVFGK